MKTSDELFRLIRSLSKTEKRYFRLFASMQRGEKKYLLLFDAIDGQQEYDEGAIRERFRGERFTRQLNVAKKYLYELILKSLRLYHDEYSAAARLRDMIQSAEILYEKGLSDQAQRTIDKVIRIAREQDFFVPLVSALRWKWNTRSDEIDSIEEIEELASELDTALARLRNINEYERLVLSVDVSLGTGRPRTAEEWKVVEEFGAHRIMRDEKAALSFSARLNRLHSLSYYYRLKKNYAAAARAIEEQIALIDGKPGYALNRPHLYIATLINALKTYRLGFDPDGYYRSKDRLKEALSLLLTSSRLTNQRVRYRLVISVLTAELVEGVLQGQFEEGPALADEVEELIRTYEPFIEQTQRIVLYTNLVMLLFGNGEFVRALEYNNRILAEEEPLARSLYRHARLVNLILHFELGHMELLPYLVRSLYRYLHAQNGLHRFESIILSFFRRLPDVATQSGLIKLFTALRKELRVLEEDEQERDVLGCFYYTEWLESKIERRDLREIVRANAQGTNLGKTFDAAA